MERYFAWQRGINENTTSLIRFCFLKGTGLSTVTKKQLDFVVNKLNNQMARLAIQQLDRNGFLIFYTSPNGEKYSFIRMWSNRIP